MLIDSHMHLQEPVLLNRLSEVLARCREQGVGRLVVNGCCEADWDTVARLARDHDEVVPCFGLHPWYVKQRSPRWLESLEARLLSIPSAVGEIGLDKWLDDRDEPAMEACFVAQMELAARLGRPVMIHCLRAWDWLIEVMTRLPASPPAMMLHAYGGAAELVERLVTMGFYFSFAGNTLDPKRTKAHKAIAVVPADRLLIETDAPDMPPPPDFIAHPLRHADGKPANSPANLRAIAQGLARIRGCTEEELERFTTANAERLLADVI